MTSFDLSVAEGDDGLRLDHLLVRELPDFSRSRLQALIKDGQVSVNGRVFKKPSEKLNVGTAIHVVVPEAVPDTLVAQDMPMDVVFEDEDVLVINKPAGLVVHPGAGNADGTLVNGLLAYCGDRLSGIGGVMRPGIVHRLDKDTSGLLIVAKNDHAHQHLSAQLQDRSLSRSYQALVFGEVFPPQGQVDFPIGRDHRNRLKMAICANKSRDARTFYSVKEQFGSSAALVMCQLETGRTHQIRVHMQAIKHPVVGDPLYGPQATALASALRRDEVEQEAIDAVLAFGRQALHAWKLSFVHPRSEDVMSFEAHIPSDFQGLLDIFRS